MSFEGKPFTSQHPICPATSPVTLLASGSFKLSNS